MLNRLLRAFTKAFRNPPTLAPTATVHGYPTPAFRRPRRGVLKHRPRKLVRLFRTSNGAWTGNSPK